MDYFWWLNVYDANGCAYIFSHPKRVLIFEEGDPKKFFLEIEKFLKKGFYVAGFFTYEFGYYLEERLKPYCKRRLEGFPLAYFGVFEAPKPFKIEKIQQANTVHFFDIALNLSFEDYQRIVSRIKSYISSGDTYQVNYTLKYHFRFKGHPRDFFFRLLRKQKVRYACMLSTAGFSILSFSPELFLEKRGSILRSSPMKGTACRGQFLEEDEKIAQRLSEDPKNRAENIMITDLVRNDFGKICEPGSVWVPELFKVERYRTVHQMISTVEGRLRKGTSFYEIMKALFPSGSVTGAPKIRTMEIIAELEVEPRGVYTGALGFITPIGDFLFNIAIRTLILKKDGRGEFGIGSGIVWDSSPEEEYKECLLKARFLIEDIPEFKLVETLRFDPEHGFVRLDKHLARLKRSTIYFTLPYPEKKIKKELEKVKKNLFERARVRILLSEWGDVWVKVDALEDFPRPVKVGLKKRNFFPEPVFLFHKTTYRPWYEKARKQAEELGLFEIIFFDEKNRLIEGTVTNIFLEINNKLYTPPTSLRLLPGILRESLLETGICEEKEIYLSDLFKGKLYIGNSARGLVPVDIIYFLFD